MVVARGSETQFLFSIYQNIESKEEANFHYQKVSRPKYYPHELYYLSQRIEDAKDPIELEKSVSHFNSFVQSRKKELSDLEKLLIDREKTNLRKIFVLTDENLELIQDNQDNIVLLAGALGGGMLQLNEDLNKVAKEDYYQIVEFNTENIGITQDSVKLDLEDGNYELKSNEEKRIDKGIFPLQLDNCHISVVRAASYFQDAYQKLSMINDFSPIIDSSVKAVNASILSNTKYFSPLPEVVKQKFDQYKLDPDLHYPNFLSIQNMVKKHLKSSNFIIQGFSSIDNGKQFSLKITDYDQTLQVFLMAECNLFGVSEVLESIKDNKELRWQINDLKSRNKDISKINNQKITTSSPILEELIGIRAIKDNIEKMNSTVDQIELPLGYVRIREHIVDKVYDRYYETSFNRSQLPPSYLRLIKDITNSLEVVLSGSLDVLSFKTNNIAVYLSVNDISVKLEMIKGNEGEITILVYLIGSIFTDLRRKMIEFDLFWKDEMEQYIDNIHVGDNLELLLELYPIEQSFSKNQYNDYLSEYPLTSFTENSLKSHTVPILLRRILKEVLRFEKETYSKNSTTLSDNIEVEDSKILQQERITNDYDKELQRLEKEVNNFNKGLFSFLMDMLRRESDVALENNKNIYTNIRSLYHDMTIALIDFGLTPEQWKFANNLQLWNSFQSQINYLKHSIILSLRKFLGEGFEGSDIDKLANHELAEKLNYNSYYGEDLSGEYSNLRKIHLSFVPLLNRYSNQLEESNNLDQLITLLEELEAKRREQIQSQLPSLPRRS